MYVCVKGGGGESDWVGRCSQAAAAAAAAAAAGDSALTPRAPMQYSSMKTRARTMPVTPEGHA